MKFFSVGKDGGPESSVTGYWLVEIKWLFSIVVLRFDGPSRDAYHDHAFNSVSWLLRGRLIETMLDGRINDYLASFWPIVTLRSCNHKVDSDGVSWVLSFRGPWRSTWKETRADGEHVLTHGRIEV